MAQLVPTAATAVDFQIFFTIEWVCDIGKGHVLVLIYISNSLTRQNTKSNDVYHTLANTILMNESYGAFLTSNSVASAAVLYYGVPNVS